MRRLGRIAGLLLCFGLFLGTNGCDSDSPTDPGTPPTISQLRAVSVTRNTATQGTLSFRFDYADPDADVFAVSFATGINNENILVPNATMTSGTIDLSRNIGFLAVGGEVPFTVTVVDRKANVSNQLQGVYQTPP